MRDKSLGAFGEDLAARFLESRGYKILERNFKVKWGEMDIIAQDRGTICFVEVKLRTSDHFGLPQEAVEIRKRRKLARVAQGYLKIKFRTDQRKSRFDVVAICRDSEGNYSPELFQNAFECP